MAEDANSAPVVLAAGSVPTPLPPPSVVPLSPFPPALRRLSMSFRCPVPIPAEPPRGRLLSWVSLQGMLLGVEKATSSATIGAGLSLEQSAAWELFTPMQRVLIVAVVAVAASDLSRRRRVSIQQQPVQIREEIFTSIQQKLDYLCEQMNSLKKREFLPFSGGNTDHPGASNCSCGFQSSHFGRLSLDFQKDEMSMTTLGDVKREPQEERRMSDLSDWNSSITSSSEIQLNASAIDQDVYNLQKDCEAMDASVKGLVDIMKCCDTASSERIADLEDIIKRKNLLITNLRKDVVILEQKVLHLTRLQRPSYLQSTANTMKLPLMASNLLYDMESSSSPSDSDSPPGDAHKQKTETLRQNHNIFDDKENQIVDLQANASLVNSWIEKSPEFSSIAANGQVKKQVINPLKEKFVTQKSDSSMLTKSRKLPSFNGDVKKIKRRNAPSIKDNVFPRR